MQLVKGKTIITKSNQKLENGYIIIKDGIIMQITNHLPKQKFEKIFEANFICPGFIDIHNHGIGGANDVEEYWLSDYTLKQLPNYGTTSVLASLTFDKNREEFTKKVIGCINEKVNVIKEGCACLAGIHAEGPIIATRGGLPNSEVDMSLDKFGKLLNLMPFLKIMTISPSNEKNIGYKRLKMLIERGIRPALGHDINCDEDAILGALKIAAEYNCKLHITHLFNVSSFHHRNISLVNFGLANSFPNMEPYKNLIPPSIEMIGDFVHVHPLTMQFTIDQKGNDLALITDAVMEMHEKGNVNYGRRKIQVCKEGDKSFVVLTETKTIAGSCSNLLQIFHNLIFKLNVKVEKAVQMLSENPAKIANLENVGTIEVGKRADILFFDEKYNLMKTMIAGKIVYSK